MSTMRHKTLKTPSIGIKEFGIHKYDYLKYFTDIPICT